MMCATAFVPLEDVEEAFDIFMDQVPDDFTEIADYFENIYVRGRRARGRRQATRPRYAPSLWNMYDAVIQNSARTNNMSEGWQNRFAVVVGCDHPSLYAFLEELRKEQGDTEGMFRELDLGRQIKKSSNHARDQAEERIASIVRQYQSKKEAGEILAYLQFIGHDVAM